MARIAGVVWLLVLVAPLAQAGTRDDPDIEDAAGDNPIGWLDIRNVWIEEVGFDVVQIWLEVEETIPFAPNQGTGGQFNGPYWYVFFDLVDWNGTRIGNRDHQHVAIRIEELITITYICVWDEHDFPCEDGFTCCHRPLARIAGPYVIWEVDFKKPMGENWTVGSGYRFENITAQAGLRAASFDAGAVTDWGPDEGFGRDVVSAPRVYANIHADTTGWGARAAEVGYLSAGIVVVTSFLVGIGRVVFRMGRYRFLQWLFLGFLFTRIERDAVLKNERRSEIFSVIQDNPGITFSEVRRRLALSSGPLVHHLSVLDRQGFVRCVQDGFRSRFYVRGARVDDDPYVTRTQESLLVTLQENPGIMQKHLARLVGLSRQGLRHHVQRLESMGKVRVEVDGRGRRHYAV